MTAPTREEQAAMWQALYERLILNGSDHEKLVRERGFDEATIKACRFKSSVASNRDSIDSLRELFPPAKLAYVGIFYEFEDGYVPSRIFCGWGPTGKTVTDAQGRERRERAAGLNPILIPYLDESGKCEILRPHKDNIRRPEDIDDLDDDYTGLHVYCPHLLRTVGANAHFGEQWKNACVLTEGEFKAAALYQCGIPALAVPGIQSVRNPAFRKQLVEILKRYAVTEVIVCFDNECKDDPELPNYKPQEWDRVDTIVYARYTASTLFREGILKTRIANLPDPWRIRGKADWDGALAGFVHGEKGHAVFTEGHGGVRGTATARKEFLKVLKGAKFERDCRDLFASEYQRIVEAKLVKLNHVRKCPVGGDDERRLGHRLRRMKDQKFSFSLGTAFLDVIGCHYDRKPKKWKPEEYDALVAGRDLAYANKQWIEYAYYKELLIGFPEPVSNCAIKCYFKLISADGKMQYLVSVRTTNNENTVQHLKVSAETLCRRTEFHKWLIENASGSWSAGEIYTQFLIADFQADSAFREIHEVETYGYSSYCNLWKFADRAFTPEDKVLLPDKNMVFWHNGVGYQTDFDKKRVGHGFSQGAPTLGELDIPAAVESFMLLQRHLKDAIGDYDGWLALGAVLSYFAHPEILRTYGGAPGLWVTGRKGGGKSTIVEWLIQIQGFEARQKSAITSGTTAVAVGRELSKYGCLMLWFDEFDALVTDQRVQDMLKNAFTRLSDLKGTFDSSKRTRAVTAETTPIVSGESSSRIPATRSRYINISVLSERSLGDSKKRLREMNAAAPKFRNLGHFIMKHRAVFVQRTMDYLEKWVADPAVARFVTDQRAIFVSGAPVAAFMAVAEMLKPHAGEHGSDIYDVLQSETNFKTFAMQHGEESQKEVIENSYVNVYWQDVLDLFQIGRDAHFKGFFKLSWARVDKSRRLEETFENKQDTLTPVLFMNPSPVYFMSQQELKKAGRDHRLSMRDLRAELRREKYWIKPQENGTHRMTSGGERINGCWCFDLSEHPLGEEFLAALSESKTSTWDGFTPESERQ